MRSLIAIALAGAALAAAAPATGGGGGPAAAIDPAPESFAFAIGNGHLRGGPQAVAERLGDHKLIVVDGELATPREVQALRQRDATVLAYLSVGTIERWRLWYPRLKRFRLAAWRDWEDEWFADVSRARLRAQLAKRIAPAILAKGFDGLFLDNVDMAEMRRYRALRPGMRKLVRELSVLARDRGGLLFTQNGLWGLRKLRLLDAIDGWNREDVTWTYDFDRRRYVRTPRTDRRAALRELAAVSDRGLITTATSYTRGGARQALARSVADACRVGALPYVSDIGLTAKRLPESPLVCP